MMIQKLWHAVGKRWGTPAIKQRIWDAEYKTGRWTYDRFGPNNESREPIYRFIDKYGRNGNILDLGCGSGMTALEMKPNFSQYIGVDISSLAIETARMLLSKEGDRSDKVQFFVADIFGFQPNSVFSLILFRESIQYIPEHRVEEMLKRYCAHLEPGGVFIIRICDTNRFKGIVHTIESVLCIQETFAEGNGSTMKILVCEPRPN